MLVIRLQTPNDPEPAWALLDSNPAADWMHGSWETLLPLTQRQALVLLVPSREVLLTHINLNTRNPRQLQQAIPYALEELLADDPETQHIVWQTHPPTDADPTRIEVAVIARARLREWVAGLQAHQLRAQTILPDVFALPWETGGITLYQQGGQVWLRTGELSGSSSVAAAFPLVLESLLPPQTAADEATAPLRVRLHTDQADAPWLHDPRLGIEPELHPEQLFSSSLQPALKLNLLQGLVDEHRAHLRQQWRHWRLAAGLAAGCAALALGMYGISTYQQQQQLNALEEANLNLFAAAFPKRQQPDTADMLHAQLGSAMLALKNAGNSPNAATSALPLLSGFAAAFAKVQGVQIQKIQAQAGILTVALQSKDRQALDALQQALEQTVGKVEPKTSEADGMVTAELTLGGHP